MGARKRTKARPCFQWKVFHQNQLPDTESLRRLMLAVRVENMCACGTLHIGLKERYGCAGENVPLQYRWVGQLIRRGNCTPLMTGHHFPLQSNID